MKGYTEGQYHRTSGGTNSMVIKLEQKGTSSNFLKEAWEGAQWISLGK